MKTLVDYEIGDVEDVILVVENSNLPLMSLGCFPLGEDDETWVKIVPMARHLSAMELDNELQGILALLRRIKSGRKKLRFALNASGAAVQLTPAFLSGLATATCRLEMGVVPEQERQKMAERKREMTNGLRPFA